MAAGGATVTASETERAMKLRMSCCNSAGQRPAVPFTPNEPKVQPNGVCGPASCERCAHTHPYYVCSCGSCCAAALYRIVEKGDWQKLQARFANSAVRQRRAPEPGRKPRRREPQGLRHRVSRCRCANDASRLPTLYMTVASRTSPSPTLFLSLHPSLPCSHALTHVAPGTLLMCGNPRNVLPYYFPVQSRKKIRKRTIRKNSPWVTKVEKTWY